jgi:predicted nucleotidyltransferase
VSHAPFSPIVRSALARLRACAERASGGAVRVVLFGSYARGEADEHSDVDVLVVVNADSDDTRRAIFDEAAAFYAEHGVLVQPVVLSSTEYEARLAGGHPLLAAIAKEGIAA